ncbi:MAG: hypothetical protein KGI57_12530 [Hyphomicrobiales bacterium]|nr:hypothetical protein [Hyphomicrobiales bacterium]MDE2018516.1 hypothetical protein [Hyphomicrobiales bacterium]
MKVYFGVATAFAAALFACAPASAAGRHTIRVQVSSGYGVDECLLGGRSCGKSVADALCAADGDGAAERFGAAADVDSEVEVACIR